MVIDTGITYADEIIHMSSSKRSVFLRLMKYALPHWQKITIAFLLLLVSVMATISGPILIKYFIDNFLTPRLFPPGWIAILVSAYFLSILIANFFLYKQLIFFQIVAMSIIHKLRLDVMEKVQQLSVTFFDKTPTGSLISRITNDTESIKELFVNVLSNLIKNFTLMGSLLIAMSFIDLKLTLYCLTFLPIIGLMMFAYRYFSTKYFFLARIKLSHVNARLNESIQGMHLIRVMSQQKRFRREYDTVIEDLKQSEFKKVLIDSALLRSMTTLIYLSALAAVLYYFGLLNLEDGVKIGTVFAFISYLEKFFEPINQISMRISLLQQALVSAERVFRLIDTEKDIIEQAPIPKQAVARGSISFQNVTFSYDGTQDVLKNISFRVEPGQTVAFVGHTGSGKSTIINLLMDFYPLETGKILLDDKPLKSFSKDELRSKIGLVQQDPFIFSGSISKNIRLGNDAISDQKIEKVTQFVQADTFIKNIPSQYQAKLNERGATLSAGQRQLISFSRTMAIDPIILVLDEATANIDTETEEAIQIALKKMRKGRTTLAIAHRLSTIQDADLILVIHKGEIVEKGTHFDLLRSKGLYHKMYLLQQGRGLIKPEKQILNHI